jgi:glycosyltransferase involved in cell wall biosynthesis
LLAVGRLDAVKNFAVLVCAFAQLADKYPDWDLVILGEGPERALLESTIRDRGLEARILVPGIAGNVGEWYGRADLYVMTSLSEGFPNALAEALSHGLPAVSFDCDTGPRDIIRHGIDGLLVPANDSAALIDALDLVMGDPNLRKQLAARAPEARERFSIEKISGMWEELFRELSATRSLANVSINAAATKGGSHGF